MREILFRGKRVDNGKWSYGSLVCWKTDGGDSRCDIFSQGLGNGVIPSTVGQYTGLDDKDGRRIFEGDIIDCPRFQCTLVVSWNNGGFGNFDYWGNDIEVIGNVHDNPELMEAK